MRRPSWRPGRNKEEVTSAEFDEAIDRVVAGLEKKKRVIARRRRKIVATNESGHAIVAESVRAQPTPAQDHIYPPGGGRPGLYQQQPTETRYLMTSSELLDRMGCSWRAGSRRTGLREIPPGAERPAAGHGLSPAPW